MRRFYQLACFSILLPTATLLTAQCPVVNAGEDLYLCFPPAPAQLNGSIDGPYIDFMWTPTTGLIGAQTLTPTVTTTQNATYVLRARGVDLSNNLIFNGDFEAGNTGFWSDYNFSPGNLVPEGVYEVLPNPQSSHPSFAPCPDHTSGSGNMMAVNGAGMPNQQVWCQTVAVTPNTDYAFSAWVTTLVAASPALLQFSINGSTIGPIFPAPSGTCNWINFYTTWNSGANSSATICIVNQNTVLGGNDFALDDIVFSPICVVTDTVKVNIVNIQAVANPPVLTIPCEGAELTLNGTGSSTGPNISYYWETPNGNIVSGETTLTPKINAAGTYTLTVTFNNGLAECTKTATVNVIPSPNQLFAWIAPPQPIGCGAPTSLLIGNSSQPAFSTYQWTAGPGGNFVSGTTSPTATVDQPGEYTLLVTNTNTGCTAEASVTVLSATNPPTAIALAFDTLSCQQPTITLFADSSSTGPKITYAWDTLGTTGKIIAGKDSIRAVVNASGTYILTVTDTNNGCASFDTIEVVANLQLPLVSIDSAGVLDCDTDTLTLFGNVNPDSLNIVWWTAYNGGVIASGDSSLNAQVIAAGNYVLAVLNPANGCIGVDTIAVSSDTIPPLAVVLTPDTITCQNPSIPLSGAGSSSGPNFNYLWTATAGGNIVSGGSTLNPVVNAAGNYTLLVTNTLTGCQAAATISVPADTNAIVAVANAPDPLTCTDTTVALNANGSSTIPGLLYAWTTTNGIIAGGADGPNPTAAAPGTYQLLLTNPANGCTATDQAIVLQNIAAPILSIGTPDTLTCANPEQTLQGQNNSPGSNFSYNWTASNGGTIASGETTLNPLITTPGTYTLTAANLTNGCTAQISTTVAIETGAPVAAAAAPGPITCADPSQMLSTAGSSTGPNFSYNWATAGGNFLNGQNSPSPLVDAPGIYTLTITNSANGCTATTELTITADTTPPPANAGPDGLLTCADPVFNLTANGGQTAPGLAFSWQTPNGGFTGNPDSSSAGTTQAGTYILTVLNTQNGCTALDTAVVSADQLPPAVSIPAPALLTCVQTTASLDAQGGSPGFTYQWTTANGQFVSGQNSATATVDAPGQYDLLVTNPANGCTSTQTATVDQNIATPLANAGPGTTLTCAAPLAVLQGQAEPGPGISVQWTTSAGGNILSGAGTPTPTVDQPGDYTLLVTNTATGCTASSVVSILENKILPQANAGPDATLSCALTTLKLNGNGSANGTATFNWTASNGGNIVAGANTAAPTIDAPGLYTLLVTDLNNGCTATDMVTVAEDATAPQASATNPGTLTCAVTQLTLQGNGSAGANFTHNWAASGGGNIVSGANTLSPVIDAPGVYRLTVTNLNNGCTATAQVTVGQNITPPAVQIAAPGTLTCTVQSLNLSGSPTGGNYNYFWQTTGGFIVSGGTSATPLINQPGQYTLRVTDQTNGCTATTSVQVVSDKTPPAISIANPEVLTCAKTVIPLTGTVSQPASNFSSNWTTATGNIVSGANSLTPQVNAPGSYSLTVQNLQNGCTATDTVVVQQNVLPPTANAGPAPTITCANPQVALDGSGSTGQGTLAFNWTGGPISSGANTAAPVVSTAVTYTLTVTDAANGCTATASVTVLQNTAPPTVLIAPPLTRTCARDTVQLDAGASSSGPNFSIQWTTANGQFSGGQNSLMPQVQAAGTYVLTILNQVNGCSSTASATVQEDLAAPNAEAGPSVELHCNLPETALNGSSSTTGNLAFYWTSTGGGNILSGANTATPLVNSAGQYLLTVTNTGNGCTATDAVTITAVLPPDFAPELTQPNCIVSKGSIAFGPVSSGVPPFRYSKDGGQQYQTSPVFGGLVPGTYDLVVIDAYGCTAGETAVIEPPFLPELELAAGPILDVGDSLLLEPVLNMPYSQVATWQWTPAGGLSCTDCPTPWAKPFRPSLYRLRITDLNGCTASAEVVVQVNRRRQLYAPNVFSPNADGENDRFLIFGKGVSEIQVLRIFDRWGNQLFLNENFQPNDELEGWDGRYRGQDMNPGVYVWQAVIEFVDGAVEVFAGDVTILR